MREAGLRLSNRNVLSPRRSRLSRISATESCCSWAFAIIGLRWTRSRLKKCPLSHSTFARFVTYFICFICLMDCFCWTVFVLGVGSGLRWLYVRMKIDMISQYLWNWSPSSLETINMLPFEMRSLPNLLIKHDDNTSAISGRQSVVCY